MANSYQITFDCADPDRMARFWAEALRYDLQGPPDGFNSWRDYWASVGVPADEVEDGFDYIIDPAGRAPRMWFQQVPEGKSVKNRLHFDILVGGGRSVPLDERRRHVDTEAVRLTGLGASELRKMDSPDQGHYAIAMADPEGNEFDVV